MLAPNMGACTEAQLGWTSPAPPARDPAGCLHPIWVHARRHSSPGRFPAIQDTAGRLHPIWVHERSRDSLGRGPLLGHISRHIAAGCLHPIWVHERSQDSLGRRPLLRLGTRTFLKEQIRIDRDYSAPLPSYLQDEILDAS